LAVSNLQASLIRSLVYSRRKRDKQTDDLISSENKLLRSSSLSSKGEDT
jgi:hypothetical protein